MKDHSQKSQSPLDFEATAIRVSTVSIIWNLVLSALKLFAGIIANSGAMISDAVHSASDVFSSFIVMIGVRISSKESDKDHPYGHERLECVAAIVLALILSLTGLGIGYSTIKSLFSAEKGTTLVVPGMLALVAAIVSILAKEAMFWYTRYYAHRIDSGALMADAWHHRSDALSSVGALIGIGGARLGFPILEPIASLFICLFIEKAAFDIFKDAIDKMVDKSCDEAFEEEIRTFARSQEGVLGIDLLHTRVFGNKIYVDLEISADGNRPLNETHAIAERVHDAIEQKWPKIKHIMVHVNPYEEKKE